MPLIYRYYIFILLAFSVSCSFGPEQSVPHTIASFKEAKKLALGIYDDHSISFYCGCRFNQQKVVDSNSCGYQPRKDARRGERIEWEHIVPAHTFGHARQCWRNPQKFAACVSNDSKTLSGRRCCQLVDPNYNAMAADLYNLVPTVGELNNDRANFDFGIINGEQRQHGACDFEVDFKAKVAEPAAHLRGDIARTYFYFTQTYGLDISEEQMKQFQTWDQTDPVDDWERKRAVRIEKIQGNIQPFITDRITSP